MAGESADGSIGPGLSPGSLVGSYRVQAQVGAGGMAAVYRATDERLNRTVALKVMATGLAADPAFRERFIRESRAAAAVDHPNVLPVYEAGQSAGVLFIAMRYVAGGDLRSVTAARGPLPAARAAGFIGAAASALDAAHAAGLVHRDVKPANMLVDSRPGQADHLYLADFGLSKGVMSGSTSLTGSAQLVGTPDYIAPEQVSGGRVDGRTDQYALACAAFAVLTAVPLFARDHPMAVLMAHLSAPPPSVVTLRPDLPPGVDYVLGRALAKDPADRYASCGEFAAALADGLSPHPVTVFAPSVPAGPVPAGFTPPGVTPPGLAPAAALEFAPTMTATPAAAGYGQQTPPGLYPGGPGIGAGGYPQPPAGPPRRPGPGRKWALVAAAVVVLAAAGVTGGLLAVPSGNKTPDAAISHQAQHSPPASQLAGSPGTSAPAASPAPSSALPATTFVVCSEPVYPECEEPGAADSATDMVTEPATLTLSGDNSLRMTGIVWTNWGTPQATGTGQYEQVSCVPDCATGGMEHYAGTVRLSGLVPYGSKQAYSDITLEAPAAVKPPMGDNITDAVPNR